MSESAKEKKTTISIDIDLFLRMKSKLGSKGLTFQSLVEPFIKEWVDAAADIPPAATDPSMVSRYMETFPAATPMEESYRKLVRMILEGYAEWAAQDLSQQANSETSESENV